jgi:hypothetical protein
MTAMRRIEPTGSGRSWLSIDAAFVPNGTVASHATPGNASVAGSTGQVHDEAVDDKWWTLPLDDDTGDESSIDGEPEPRGRQGSGRFARFRRRDRRAKLTGCVE